MCTQNKTRAQPTQHPASPLVVSTARRAFTVPVLMAPSPAGPSDVSISRLASLMSSTRADAPALHDISIPLPLHASDLCTQARLDTVCSMQAAAVDGSGAQETWTPTCRGDCEVAVALWDFDDQICCCRLPLDNFCAAGAQQSHHKVDQPTQAKMQTTSSGPLHHAKHCILGHA